MNVVLYLRYSSEKQTEQSIEGQERVCREFCSRNGYDVVDVYVDRALSAFENAEKRAAFQKMIADAGKNRFEAIIVYKLDRFSRNRYDSAIYKNKLKKCGVRVISATEPLSDSPEGIILEAMLEAMAEYYSQELSQKIKRGMHESAVKHKHLGGHTPLGYKVEDHRLVLDPVTAPLVKQAFEMYADGHMLTEICKLFNDRGIKTSKGAAFNKCSFHSIFKNERYIGVYNTAGIREEGVIPAIVDEDLFQRVQDRMAYYKHAPGTGKATVDYMLSGKAYCGHCGTLLLGSCGTSKTGERYYYYICGNHKNQKCDKKNIRKERLERAVLEDAKEMLTPANIEILADLCMKAVEEENNKNTDVAAVQAEIADLDKRIANLTSLAEQTGDIEQIATRIGVLSAEKKSALKRLKTAQNSTIPLQKETIVWWLSQFVSGSIDDPVFARLLIDLVVNSVIVYDAADGFDLDIIYNTTGKKQKSNAKHRKHLMSSYMTNSGSPLTVYTNTLTDGVLIVRKKHSL